jgi:hypothetical protein
MVGGRRHPGRQVTRRRATSWIGDWPTGRSTSTITSVGAACSMTPAATGANREPTIPGPDR